MSDGKSIWEYAEDGYDAFTNLFGDDALEEGIRAGYNYLTEDDQSSSSCLLYTSPSPRDGLLSRMPSSA